jgi:hypothetical protein
MDNQGVAELDPDLPYPDWIDNADGAACTVAEVEG